MILYENIQKAMGVDIAISQKMSDAIYRWGKMYTNEAPWIKGDIKSLGLPASICTEMARLVTMESEIKISGSRRADLIAQYMVPFLSNLSRYVEYACSTGGISFKPYMDSRGVAIDVTKAGYFYPVSFDSAENITGVIFPEFKRVGKQLFTRLEYQQFGDDTYTVINRAFVSKQAQVKNDNVVNLGQEISLDKVPEWGNIAPYTEFKNADRTLFSYFKIPVANNIDPESPLGVSIFARAVEQIRDADEQYGATLWEYRSKETAIQATSEFFKRNRKGETILPKGNERQYVDMGNGITDGEGKPFFNVFSPEIRDESFFNGYNKIIQKVEFNSGLAYGTLSDPQVIEKTAEEIKMSKQRSYSTVKAIQNNLENAVKVLVNAVDAWMTIEDIAPPGRVNIAMSWDDSLVTDKKAEREQDLKDLAAGILQAYEYRMKWYGEDEAKARKMVATPAEVLE